MGAATALLAAASAFLYPHASKAQKRETSSPPSKDVVLATVDGKPITSLDVFLNTASERQRLAAMFTGKELEKEMLKLKLDSINNLIDRKLVYDRFKKRGYSIPDQIVEKLVDRIAADVAGGDRKKLEKKAREVGMTIEEIKEKARERASVRLLLDARCDKAVYITPSQVKEYYETHKTEFAKPTRVNLQVLFLKPEHKRLAEQLKPLILKATEKAFAGYVALNSDSVRKTTGGKIGWINEKKLRPEFALAISGKPVGTVAGPVETREGFYFIRLAEREAPSAPPFEKLRSEIKSKLTGVEVKKKYDQYVGRLRRDAVIRIFLEQKN
jgi:parvulin-like peptidyl-prolyl isomerase